MKYYAKILPPVNIFCSCRQNSKIGRILIKNFWKRNTASESLVKPVKNVTCPSLDVYQISITSQNCIQIVFHDASCLELFPTDHILFMRKIINHMKIIQGYLFNCFWKFINLWRWCILTIIWLITKIWVAIGPFKEQATVN